MSISIKKVVSKHSHSRSSMCTPPAASATVMATLRSSNRDPGWPTETKAFPYLVLYRSLLTSAQKQTNKQKIGNVVKAIQIISLPLNFSSFHLLMSFCSCKRGLCYAVFPHLTWLKNPPFCGTSHSYKFWRTAILEMPFWSTGPQSRNANWGSRPGELIMKPDYLCTNFKDGPGGWKEIWVLNVQMLPRGNRNGPSLGI